MTSLKDVVAVAEECGFVSVGLLQEKLSLTEEQACKAVKACWDRGLISPTSLSWFGLSEEGECTSHITPEKKAQFRDVTWGPAQKEKWYGDELEKIRSLYVLQGCGLSVNDVVGELAVSTSRARKILEILTELDGYETREATAGGAFGRRPLIYFREEADYWARNQVFVDAAPLKEKQRGKRISEGKAARRKIPTTQSVSGESGYEQKEKPRKVHDEWDSPFDA